MAKLPDQYLHTWQGMAGAGDPLGVPWWVMVVGIGLCASPAYWCTDFLLVQRALAAKDLASARKTPLVAAIPKMFFPVIVTTDGYLLHAKPRDLPLQEGRLLVADLCSDYEGYASDFTRTFPVSGTFTPKTRTGTSCGIETDYPMDMHPVEDVPLPYPTAENKLLYEIKSVDAPVRFLPALLWLRRWGMIVLAVAVFTGGLGVILSPPLHFVARLLRGGIH